MSPLLSYAFSNGENNGHSRSNYNEVGEGDNVDQLQIGYTEVFKHLSDTVYRTLTTFRVPLQRKDSNKVLQLTAYYI